jgi:hypothetical protein
MQLVAVLVVLVRAHTVCLPHSDALSWHMQLFAVRARTVNAPALTCLVCLQALGKILLHAGADPALQPQPALMAGVPERMHALPMSFLQQQAIYLLQERYRTQRDDLRVLLDAVLPSSHFLGLPLELHINFQW